LSLRAQVLTWSDSDNSGAVDQRFGAESLRDGVRFGRERFCGLRIAVRGEVLGPVEQADGEVVGGPELARLGGSVERRPGFRVALKTEQSGADPES